MDAKLAPEDKNIFNGDLTEDSGIRLGKKLIDGSLDCTAIFVANDKMAVGLANYLHTHGKRIPEDYSIQHNTDYVSNEASFSCRIICGNYLGGKVARSCENYF